MRAHARVTRQARREDANDDADVGAVAIAVACGRARGRGRGRARDVAMGADARAWDGDIYVRAYGARGARGARVEGAHGARMVVKPYLEWIEWFKTGDVARRARVRGAACVRVGLGITRARA